MTITAKAVPTFGTLPAKKLPEVRRQFEVKMPTDISWRAWERIEPRCRSDDFVRGLQARTADPAWFLARQWQTGEFKGEDAGSPLEVSLRYYFQPVNRVRLRKRRRERGKTRLQRFVRNSTKSRAIRVTAAWS